ncbi:MAG: S-adenosylmethionine decarboxylase [Candidatus Wildermuthbacteria bacterium]|nr:S-adenosylmethionine decarboxylase [Candidatus Wildermuthbacteria bacterium]
MRANYTKTYHIIFDAFGVAKELLNSEEFALKILLEVPKLIGMKILSGPNLVRDYDRGHEGVTGFAIVDFSHVSLHTFVATQEIFLDIFSCKPFDYAAVREYLYGALRVNPDQVETVEVAYPWEKE